MKRLIFSTLILIATTLTAFGQDNYLERGNSYLNIDQLDKAEQTFREGIDKEPENLIYQCQLGLTLINQEKYNEAQEVLDKVLKQDSNQVAALWYSGIGNYQAGNDRAAIKHFEKGLNYFDNTSGQHYTAYWYIGKSYSYLLRTEGLTYDETDRMFESYEEYLRFQPDADDADEIREYVERKKKRRPSDNVKKWVDM